MKKVKCTSCGTVSKQGTKFCPNCGAPLENAEIIDDSHVKKKSLIIAASSAAVLLAAVFIITIVPNLNPKGKYQSLMEQGKTEEADLIYQEKISSDEELVQELKEEEEAKIQQIYENYKSGNVSYDDAVSQLAVYKESELTKEKAYSAAALLSGLKQSMSAYDKAVQAEKEADYETALSKYQSVIEADPNYSTAKGKISKLKTQIRNDYVTKAEEYAAEKKYGEALDSIQDAISKVGDDDELEALSSQYTELKHTQYAKVIVTNKTTTDKDIYSSIFYDYVHVTFEITNNCDKTIKGIEGVLTVNDLFGKTFMTSNCDFTDDTFEPGETRKGIEMHFECNPFIDSHMKLFNTDYENLQFEYDISSIVFEDGTTVVPE